MIRIIEVAAKDQNRWNALVAQEASFALQQSWEWGVFKEKMGWQVFRFAVEEEGIFTAGVQLLVKPLPTGLASVGYVPRGPVGDWMNVQKMPLLFSAMGDVAHKKKVIFIKIEPPIHHTAEFDQLMRGVGYNPTPRTNQPRATLILDLSPDIDSILAKMRKKTRQYVRGAEREGITVRLGQRNDLPAFYELMYQTGRREKFTPRPAQYYEREWEIFSEKGNCVLLLAFHQEHLIAGRMVFCMGSHAAEFHGGSVDDLGKLHPNYSLVWKAIQWAKDNGCQTYDFWGIPDELGSSVGGPDPLITDRIDGLWGVYRFKSGFCNNIVRYAGAYDHARLPLLHSLLNSKLLDGDAFERAAVLLDSFISNHTGKNGRQEDHHDFDTD